MDLTVPRAGGRVRRRTHTTASGTPVRSIEHERQSVGCGPLRVYYMTPEEIAELEQQWRKKRAR
jgi:hypothetical protein